MSNPMNQREVRFPVLGLIIREQLRPPINVAALGQRRMRDLSQRLLDILGDGLIDIGHGVSWLAKIEAASATLPMGESRTRLRVPVQKPPVSRWLSRE
ncbi:hypothetical protein [Williamsia sp. D3]|uniref:hypothetical protein n=1 Tax=Williamsia sp. D3 TaxID=1313067 RepID=UPI001F2C039A|nr:hypothetical protein [Williamsia sp. D3]